MKYLLDSDHISILFHEAGDEYQALCVQLAAHPRTDVGLSVISLHEQFLGCHAFLNQQRRPEKIIQGYQWLSRMARLYATAPLVDYDAAATVVYDTLGMRSLRIGTMDRRIAAIAISAGLVLVTRNRSDFDQIPELVTEDWTI